MGCGKYEPFLNGTLAEHQSVTAQGWACVGLKVHLVIVFFLFFCFGKNAFLIKMCRDMIVL